MPNSAAELPGCNNTALTYANGNCTALGRSAARWKLGMPVPLLSLEELFPTVVMQSADPSAL